jgi:peptidoglycan hydrolase-like protein with peptidoglycan-binding domain
MRLCVVVFLAVASAISINALYLQHAPRIAGAAVQNFNPDAHEAVTSTAATSALPSKTPARRAESRTEALVDVAQAAAHQPAAHSPAKPASAKLVKAIQRELSDRGYAAGDSSGVLNLQSRAAIIAYEFDEHMPLTGEPSAPVLKSLIFGRAAGKGGPGPADRFERKQRLVAQVQQALGAMRYRSGPADGRLDGETRAAIRKFENDHQLKAAGRLTERVILELVIAMGRPFDADG